MKIFAMPTPTNGYKSIWNEILVKNGPWAAIAVALGFFLWLTTIKPMAAMQESVSTDRERLMNAVTISLERNSASMATMSQAVEELNNTLVSIKDSQLRMENASRQSAESMNKFASEVSDCHDKQVKKLDEINQKLNSDGPG